ncbi:hypothetical protein CVT25_006995 [Psilocybe cyanescens]|uniref:Uncharacterized protein n=1 Tax=Psilocybe cyanescens TaxID=93625 RepID=A0A409WYB4_PSICY|nr:hypothetical protein CVT25_006995 [Psilocybe cyanescens]
MIFGSGLSLVCTALLATLATASPALYTAELQARQAVDNIVYVTNAQTFCEVPGGMKTYCSPAGRYSPDQGQLPPDFWSNVAFTTGTSSRGARFAQLTGCIRPEKLSRLNPNDSGGQYDSSGGAGGLGNPQGSKCLGYNHYVELVEPADRRACIKCCDNYDDCPLHLDTAGCPQVIPGNYFDCN